MSLRSLTSRVVSSIETSSISQRLKPNRRSNTFFQGNIYYTKTHEWIQLANTCELPVENRDVTDQVKNLTKVPSKMMARIGVSDFRSIYAGDFYKVALDQLDLEFQDIFIKGKEICEIDTATDFLESFRMPVNARITNVNSELLNLPMLANRDPENQGWLAEVEIMNFEQLGTLMNKKEYDDYLRNTPGCYTASCEI